jgi:hypothetical protein
MSIDFFKPRLGALSLKFRIFSLVAAGWFAFFGSTAVSHAFTNLIANPGAELGTGNDAGSTVTDWVVGGTSNPGRDNGSFDGFTPPQGSYSFYGGSGAEGTLSQLIDLNATGVSSTDTDAGKNTVQFTFEEQSLDQGTPSDEAEVIATFENASQAVLAGGYDSTAIYNIGSWKLITSPVLTLPDGTRFINYEMKFIRQQGTDLDSFIDANSTVVSTSGGVTPPPPGVPLPSAAWMGLVGLAMIVPITQIRAWRAKNV